MGLRWRGVGLPEARARGLLDRVNCLREVIIDVGIPRRRPLVVQHARESLGLLLVSHSSLVVLHNSFVPRTYLNLPQKVSGDWKIALLCVKLS